MSLTVSNNSGQNTTTITDYINVIGAPSSTFTGTVSNNTITLSNSNASANSSIWTIFNGNTSTTLTGDLVTFTAPTNGDYGVYLTNANECGQTQSDTVIYNISAYPNVVFSVNNGNVLKQLSCKFYCSIRQWHDLQLDVCRWKSACFNYSKPYSQL
ncbi:MAG: hypothetical protein U0T36_03305 [Saprospiraceae bacterium]